jgi:hypothetical protein
MADAANTRQSDFSDMDNAGISKEHWKIVLISGVGFFTDAYDLFIIGVVMTLLKPMRHVGKFEEGPGRVHRSACRRDSGAAFWTGGGDAWPQAYLWC